MNIGQINKIAAHPVTWVAFTLVIAVWLAWVANDYMNSQARNDRQLTAFANLAFQTGGATIPPDMWSGVEMFASTPQGLFDQLFKKPEEMCVTLKCEEAFGAKLDAQSIVSIATAVRDVKLRRDAGNSAMWANIMAAASLVIALLSFVVSMRQKPS